MLSPDDYYEIKGGLIVCGDIVWTHTELGASGVVLQTISIIQEQKCKKFIVLTNTVT